MNKRRCLCKFRQSKAANDPLPATIEHSQLQKGFLIVRWDNGFTAVCRIKEFMMYPIVEKIN